MAANRPRALLVAPTVPEPSGNGLAMRLSLFRDALARAADVETMVLPVSGPAPAERHEGDRKAFVVPVAGRGATQFALLSRIADPEERLRQFRRYGRGSRHAALSAPVLGDVRRAIEGRSYDLVHVGRLYLAEAAPGLANRATLDLDEDDAWAWRHLAETQREGEAAWSRVEAEAEDRLLGRVGGRFDARFVAGSADRAALTARFPELDFELVPNAVTFPAVTERHDDGRTLLFVGAFGYPPNVEGVLWFTREVWPRIRAVVPAARLRLVGRSAPQAIRALTGVDGIEVVGAVDEVDAEYARATLAIAPLHTGAGTRIKLIEAAAHRVPTVSTAIAARGLDYASSETMWLADSPTDFANAILVALGDETARRNRAVLARSLAQATHDRRLVVERLASRFAAMLASGAYDRGRP